MISQAQAMAELHRYSMEEMRNRGLEEAALVIEGGDLHRWIAVRHIRSLKRDPALQLSDWWAEPTAVPADFVPLGA